MLELSRPKDFPEVPWHLMEWELSRMGIEGSRRTEALRTLIEGFEKRRVTLSMKAAVDYAYDQIPDPEKPTGLPRWAWRTVRGSLALRQRYYGLICYATTFDALRAHYSLYIAKAWATGNAVGTVPTIIAKKLIRLLLKSGGDFLSL
jgi:hypothetical protein